MVECYFSTRANAYLELELAREVGAHGSVAVGRLRRRRRRRAMFVSTTNANADAHGRRKDEREGVMVRWDPSNPYASTYEELMEAFWRAHDPRLDALDEDAAPASVIYVTTEAQCAAAERGVSNKIEELGDGVLTRVENALEFNFEPAPECKQRVLERRAAEDVNANNADGQHRGPVGTIVGTITFAIDWTKYIAVDSTVWALKRVTGKASTNT